jgi:hypothetical protein
MSSGTGARITTFSPVNGCVNSVSYACSSGLRTLSDRSSFLFHSAEPYASSPMIGVRRSLRWTRIWCVRPVSMRSNAALIFPSNANVRTWVNAGLPGGPS